MARRRFQERTRLTSADTSSPDHNAQDLRIILGRQATSRESRKPRQNNQFGTAAGWHP